MDATDTACTSDGDPLSAEGGLLGFGHPADVAGKGFFVTKGFLWRETRKCIRHAGKQYRDDGSASPRPVSATPVPRAAQPPDRPA